MDTHEVKPIWTSSTFLVYTGGLTVLGGGAAALAYLSGHYGKGAEAGWALLVLVILYTVAHALRLRGRPIAAGIFAFASVLAWAAFIVLLFEWWGWNGVNGDLKHWSWSRLTLWLLILAAAWDDRRRFRFPFIRVISAVVGWLFVVDLITAGGNFTVTVNALTRADPGFTAERVLSLQFSLGGKAYAANEAVVAFEARALEKLRGLPGVEGVALAGQIPKGDINRGQRR